MNRNVLDFEPHLALFVTDEDPLAYYKALIGLAGKILEPCGKVYFEINEAMGDSIVKMLECSGYSELEIVKDINAKERIIKGTNGE